MPLKDDLSTYLGPTTAKEVIDETLAGIVLFVSQVPLCVVFTKLVSDRLSPTVGLHSTWMVGLIMALSSGTPPMINGCAGGLGSLMAGFVIDGEGLELLFCSISLAGLLMIIWSYYNMDRFLALIPVTVMIGYCNGLAALIAKGQLGWFHDSCNKFLEGEQLNCTCVHFVIGFGSAFLVPKISGKIPAAFVAIVTGCIVEFLIFRPNGFETFTIEGINNKTMCGLSQANEGGLGHNTYPKPFFLDSSYDMSKIDLQRDYSTIIQQAILIALVCAMDHLMTIEVLVDLTGIEGTNRQQLFAVGVANLVSGFFGGIGGNSLVEMCLILLSAGGSHRLSTIIPPLGVAAVVFFASGILNWFPVGVLAGITIKAVCDLFKWSSVVSVIATFVPVYSDGKVASTDSDFKRWIVGLQLPKFDAFIIVVTSIVIYNFSNLAYGLLIGVFFASIRFAWEARGHLNVRISETGDQKTYHIQGNLFFASDRIQGFFTPDSDPRDVKIDFKEAVIHDFSVVHAFNALLDQYEEKGTKVVIVNLDNSIVLHSLLNLHRHVEHGPGSIRRMSQARAHNIRSLSSDAGEMTRSQSMPSRDEVQLRQIRSSDSAVALNG